MKKYLFVLASLFAIFIISGCAEEKSINKYTAQSPNPEPKPVTEMYEITFFYTDYASTISSSSDCNSALKYVDKSLFVTSCDNAKMKGYGLIDFDGKNINLKTKLQMTNERIANETGLYEVFRNKQYSFTNFTPIPISAVKDNVINVGDTAVKGISGRNLNSLIPSKECVNDETKNNGCSTYTLNKEDENTIVIKIVDKSNEIPENTVIRMSKIKNVDKTLMEMNKELPEPKITGFIPEPQ